MIRNEPPPCVAIQQLAFKVNSLQNQILKEGDQGNKKVMPKKRIHGLKNIYSILQTKEMY